MLPMILLVTTIASVAPPPDIDPALLTVAESSDYEETATHEQVKLNGDSVLVVLGGIYRDRLRRTDAGWRIEKRTLTSVYVTGKFLPPQEVQRFEKPPAP